MWIVRLALSRPKTVAILAMLIVLLGVLSIVRTPTDVFPAIDIPVVSIVWGYGGLQPAEMEARIVNICERGLTTTVGNIEHIESDSLAGTSIIKVYFQPGASLPVAISQIESSIQSDLDEMPPGITPPLIMQFQASDVPIIQLSLSSPTLTAMEINDQATNFVRTPLVTIKGAQVSPPYGGVYRAIVVDLNPQKMYAYGISGADIVDALAEQNLILPAGDAKIGSIDYSVKMNNSTDTIPELNNLPIKMVNGSMIFIRDVANVHNGHGVQQNMVNVNGKPSVLLTILKNGDASTLDVVARIKAALPMIRKMLPPALNLNLLLDQSLFVKASIKDVVEEGCIAAVLTAVMILLFLGNWRSTLIVFLSIPLSVLTSIVVTSALGETLNTMTLGGLALAVGILVDDATVEIENTSRNLEEGIPLHTAILTTAQQLALPTLASTLSICIVFVPVMSLSGAAKSLFVPLGLSVVFAMLASYLLSRTLVTSMMQALLRKEERMRSDPALQERHRRTLLWKIHNRINTHFDKLRDDHHARLDWALNNRRTVLAIFIVALVVSAVLTPFVGEEFFPQVDSGQMRLHVRAAPGTRLEQTAVIFGQIEHTIRQVIPRKELSLIVDNFGTVGGLNSIFNTSGTLGSSDGEIDISLTSSHHSTWDYQAKLRQALQARFPHEIFFFQPADITNQILDFGISAPVDIQVAGPIGNQPENYELAKKILAKAAAAPGVVDAHIKQIVDEPQLTVDVDRDKAMQVGLTQTDVASSVLLALSSSYQTAPAHWLDPKNGVQYSVTALTPEYRIQDFHDLLDTPVGSTSPMSATAPPEPMQLLGNLATPEHTTVAELISHYDIEPVYDVFLSTQGRDLGGVSGDVNRLLASMSKQVPRGSTVTVRGQVATMNQSFIGLGAGLIFAIVLIYVLLVVNFESWRDPFVILMASPAVLCGVIWMLFVTGTPFSVPALMGTIMCIGVATANSVLLVTAANDHIREGMNPPDAMLAAGRRRLRPVIMTATAMIIGVFPMSLGLGTGGEENMPLGRAVIGGLLVATFSTLLFVPVVYSYLHRSGRKPRARQSEAPQETAKASAGA